MVSFVAGARGPSVAEVKKKQSLCVFGRGNIVGKSVSTASQKPASAAAKICHRTRPATVIAAHTVFWWKIIIARRYNRDTIMALDMEMVLWFTYVTQKQTFSLVAFFEVRS